MPFFANRRGLTIIEIMISIAVAAILTAITFVSLSGERSKSAVRRAAEQIQVDVQGMQIRAQSGLVLTATEMCHKIKTDGNPDPNAGQPCTDATVTADCCVSGPCLSTCTAQPPVSYGIAFLTGPGGFTYYQTFADINLDGAGNNHPDRLNNNGVEDLTTHNLPSGVVVIDIRDGEGTSTPNVDLTFDVPTGKLHIVYQDHSDPGIDCMVDDSHPACESTSIIVKNTALRLCYSVEVNAAALGTVNRRVVTSCP